MTTYRVKPLEWGSDDTATVDGIGLFEFFDWQGSVRLIYHPSNRLAGIGVPRRDADLADSEAARHLGGEWLGQIVRGVIRDGYEWVLPIDTTEVSGER